MKIKLIPILFLVFLVAAACNNVATNQNYSPNPVPAQVQGTTTTNQSQPSGLSNNHYYTNSSGNVVHSPAYSNGTNQDSPVMLGAPAGAPPGSSAQCADGTYSFSQHKQGTCSHHGGVYLDWGFQDQ